MQQPSSLIFLAIVVIWAAYLLQHWIRRREALATARSVDQFSDAMRVLERREHRTDGIVEQASDEPNASRTSAPRVSESGPRPSLRAGTVMTGETQQTPHAPATDQQVESPAASAADKLAAAGQFAAHAGSPKLRAIALVGSLALLIITVVCAPFGALPWWSPILMVFVSGGVFWWCRASAMAAAATQSSGRRPVSDTARRPREARGARPEPMKLPKRKPAPTAAPVPMAKATMPDPQPHSKPQPIVQSAPAPAAEQVFDISASPEQPAAVVDEAPVAPAEPLFDADLTADFDSDLDADLAADLEVADSWEPVAVPRPTYTMKERAPERPQQAPAPTTDQRSYDDIANEDLPFDGLALDQDLDDLPSVFRAG